jgi:hypothetical protein
MTMAKSELFVPSRTLSIGVYRLTLMVTRNVSSNVTTSVKSAYVRINPAGIVVNAVALGTSMITRGEQQDLQLNPGLYSVDLDENQFNASVNPPPVSFSFDGLMNYRIGLTNTIVESTACQVFLRLTVH